MIRTQAQMPVDRAWPGSSNHSDQPEQTGICEQFLPPETEYLTIWYQAFTLRGDLSSPAHHLSRPESNPDASEDHPERGCRRGNGHLGLGVEFIFGKPAPVGSMH